MSNYILTEKGMRVFRCMFEYQVMFADDLERIRWVLANTRVDCPLRRELAALMKTYCSTIEVLPEMYLGGASTKVRLYKFPSDLKNALLDSMGVKSRVAKLLEPVWIDYHAECAEFELSINESFQQMTRSCVQSSESDGTVTEPFSDLQKLCACLPGRMRYVVDTLKECQLTVDDIENCPPTLLTDSGIGNSTFVPTCAVLPAVFEFSPEFGEVSVPIFLSGIGDLCDFLVLCESERYEPPKDDCKLGHCDDGFCCPSHIVYTGNLRLVGFDGFVKSKLYTCMCYHKLRIIVEHCPYPPRCRLGHAAVVLNSNSLSPPYCKALVDDPEWSARKDNKSFAPVSSDGLQIRSFGDDIIIVSQNKAIISSALSTEKACKLNPYDDSGYIDM